MGGGRGSTLGWLFITALKTGLILMRDGAQNALGQRGCLMTDSTLSVLSAVSAGVSLLKRGAERKEEFCKVSAIFTTRFMNLFFLFYPPPPLPPFSLSLLLEAQPY